ncbi:conserved protein of unknown function [Burkholderia multivorans]
MRKGAVRNGDPTTTRGLVIAHSSTIYDDGRHVALSGDEATCGNCSGAYKIVGTGKGIYEKGRAVVVDGDAVLCPCRKNRVIVGRNPGIFLESSRSVTSTDNKPAAHAAAEVALGSFDGYFQLVDQNGQPLGDVLAYLQTPSGEIKEITTTPQGTTPIIEGLEGESIMLLFNNESR